MLRRRRMQYTHSGCDWKKHMEKLRVPRKGKTPFMYTVDLRRLHQVLLLKHGMCGFFLQYSLFFFRVFSFLPARDGKYREKKMRRKKNIFFLNSKRLVENNNFSFLSLFFPYPPRFLSLYGTLFPPLLALSFFSLSLSLTLSHSISLSPYLPSFVIFDFSPALLSPTLLNPQLFYPSAVANMQFIFEIKNQFHSRLYSIGKE